jgi:hypothetical protein
MKEAVTMKRLAPSAAAVLVSALFVPAAWAAKPACGDITGLTGIYDSNKLLSVDISVASRGCGVTVEYYLFVRDEAGDADPTWNVSTWASGGATVVSFSQVGPIPDDDPVICLSARSQTARTWDPAPDTGCLALTAGGGRGSLTDPSGDVLRRA